MIGFLLFSGVPTIYSIKVLRRNSILVHEIIKDDEFSAKEVLQMIFNVKKRVTIKREILLEKYYDFVSPSFTEDSSKDKYSRPISRMLCQQLINQTSKIPITDKETNMLTALLLRIGKKSYSDHYTRLKRINSLVSISNFDENRKDFSNKEIEYYLEQVDLARGTLRKALNEADVFFTRLDEIKKNIK